MYKHFNIMDIPALTFHCLETFNMIITSRILNIQEQLSNIQWMDSRTMHSKSGLLAELLGQVSAVENNGQSRRTYESLCLAGYVLGRSMQVHYTHVPGVMQEFSSTAY